MKMHAEVSYTNHDVYILDPNKLITVTGIASQVDTKPQLLCGYHKILLSLDLAY